MALRNIMEQGEPCLEKHCRPVTEFNEKLHILLDDMAETLMKANGVGLAAPQVGILRRAVLVLETNVPEGQEDRPLSPPGVGLVGMLIAKYGKPGDTVPTSYKEAYDLLMKRGVGIFGSVK
jgi:hypothetical protein